MRRISGVCLGWVLAAVLAAPACGQFIAPDGYRTISLGLYADSMAISPDGRLAIARGSTITLYDTWMSGRTALGSISNAGSWSYFGEMRFLDDSTLVVGENGPSDTLWRVSFAGSAAQADMLAPAGTFTNLQGVSIMPDGRRVLVSGTLAPFGRTGGLYLKSFDLVSGRIQTITSDRGQGWVGGTALSPNNEPILLDSGKASGIARVYRPGSDAEREISLADGHGSGAYAIAFDKRGDAYITTGATITRIRDLHGQAIVDEFGHFAEGPAGWPFPSNIEYTGDHFRPGHAGDSGALIVNGAWTSEGGLFAVVPADFAAAASADLAIANVPEPSAMVLLAAGILAAAIRRRS